MAPVPVQVGRDVGFQGRGHELFIITLVFTIAAASFVAVRMGVRMSMSATGRDDYTILTSLFFSAGMAAATCAGVYYGYGEPGKLLSESNHDKALQFFYVVQILYKFTINLTKASILLLYLRFIREPIYIRLNHAIMGYVVVYAVCSISVTAFQCVPVPRTWDKSVAGGCISLEAFWYAGAAINVSSDLMILLLPMPTIFKMNCPRREKIGLALVFAVGGFVCMTSILRMTTLKFSSTAPDPTDATTLSTIWTIIEANMGIMCSCSPMLKTPLARLFPHIFSRSGTRSATDPLSGRRTGPIHAATGFPLRDLLPRTQAGPANAGRSMNLDGAGGCWEVDGAPASSSSVVVGGVGVAVGGGLGVGGGSRDRLVRGGGGVGVPPGAISKTTDVDVRVHY